MKRVTDICPCVYGQLICTKCKISSEIGWFKTDGTDIFCPICDFKVGYFRKKEMIRKNETDADIKRMNE